MTGSLTPGTDAGITIAIPVFNEEHILVDNVARLIDYLQGLQCPYQILIGSNGSTDATVVLGERLQGTMPTLEFFHLPERGVGLAFREFIARARYPVVISMDMDLSADIRFIERAAPLLATNAVVVGSKKLAAQRRSAFRRLGSDTFLWCARRLTGLPYDDYSIGAKAFRVDFATEHASLIDAGSAYVLGMCFAAHHSGRGVACVPVACEDHRTSKFNLLSEAGYKFHRLGQLWWRATGASNHMRHPGRLAALRARVTGHLPQLRRRLT